MFLPKDFKHFAEKVVSKLYLFNPYQQAALRSSISRSYYYIFLELRETLVVNFPKEIREKFLNDAHLHHCLIEKILYQIGLKTRNKNFIKASKTFKYSRKLRNQADYDLRDIFTEEVYENFLLDIEKIEVLLQKIKEIDRNILTATYEEAKQECKRR